MTVRCYLTFVVLRRFSWVSSFGVAVWFQNSALQFGVSVWLCSLYLSQTGASGWHFQLALQFGVGFGGVSIRFQFRRRNLVPNRVAILRQIWRLYLFPSFVLQLAFGVSNWCRNCNLCLFRAVFPFGASKPCCNSASSLAFIPFQTASPFRALISALRFGVTVRHYGLFL